ncbi:MAG: Acetyl esterase Axe7A precursor [Lentisphaerae bacterium ADurb.Bin242]|nr:MAG: Acetyl esterase Axe7A precursor [Lentisphaerae bacterium ADurb.Bin242]
MKKHLLTVAALLASLTSQGAYSLQLRMDKSDAHYKAGETAVCNVLLLKDGKPVSGEKLLCTVKWEGVPVRRDIIECGGVSGQVPFKGEKPGWVYFGFEVLGKDGKPLRDPALYTYKNKPGIAGEAGAMFDAEKIKAVGERPADFDEYWAKCRADLDKIPLNAKIKELELPEPHRNKVRLFAVTVDCLGNLPVTGYLALPVGARPKHCIAVVDFLSWSSSDANRNAAISAAAEGAIGFAATWHGLPAGRPRDFYVQELKKPEHNVLQDCNNRDKWYFRNVYFRVMRALDYVKSLPEWDGKTLIVRGGSLGGLETIVAAALDPNVTLAVAGVPAFCEFNGRRAGRRRSIPYRSEAFDRRFVEEPGIPAAMAYFDAVNFAPRIRCEIFVCTGFTDELCSPSNVYAFFNHLPDGKKFMTTDPYTGHGGTTVNVQGDERLRKQFKEIKVRPYQP